VGKPYLAPCPAAHASGDQPGVDERVDVNLFAIVAPSNSARQIHRIVSASSSWNAVLSL
jgi:hypothetical protein